MGVISELRSGNRYTYSMNTLMTDEDMEITDNKQGSRNKSVSSAELGEINT